MKQLLISLAIIAATVPFVYTQTSADNELDLSRFLKNPDDGLATKISESDEIPEIVKKPERGSPTTEVSFTYSQQFLSNGRGIWKEGSVDVIHKFSARKVLYGSYLETERFEKNDRQANVGFYQPLDEKWTLLLEAGASPTHRVLPKWSAMAQIERSFGNGWIGQAGIKRTEHENAKVNIAKLGVEKYWGMNRAAYSLSVNNLVSTGTSPSQRIQYNRYYGGNVSNFGVSFALGREIENIGANRVLQSDIYNISVNGKHWFNHRWAAGYGFTFHKQGDIYDRRGLQFGIHYRF